MNSAAKKIDLPNSVTASTSVEQNAGVQAAMATEALLSNVAALRPQVIMPWDTGLGEDKRFKRWLKHGAGICTMLAIFTLVMPQKESPVAVKKENRQQYAQLVIEEKFIPPPVVEKPKPEPVVERKKPEPLPAKKAEKKVEKPKPVANVEQPPKPVQKKPSEAELRAKAREKAANSGLLALSDQLSTLRDQSTSSVSNLNSGGDKAKSVKRNVLAAKTDNSLSGGASVSQQSAAGGLGGREQAAVVVSEVAVQAVESTVASSSYQQSRSADEVRRVMDSNKGAIYSVYNRALRKNPTLEGTFGFSLTIEPSGQISNVSLLNSELDDSALEKRLLARIRMIKFDPKDVGVTEVNYSFDFLPY